MNQRTGTALLFAGTVLVSLLIAEGAVRYVAHSGGPLARQLSAWDPGQAKVVPHGHFGYKPKPGVTFSYPRGTIATENAMGYRGPVVSVPKPPGTVRVVLLGESTTHGWGVDDSATIDAYLRPLLAERLPGRAVEVVNLGFDGYDAYQIWQRLLTDGAGLQPDAIVLNTGINDVRNARFAHLADPDPRTLIWEGDMRRQREEAARGGPSIWTRVKHHWYLARLPGAVRQLMVMRRAVPERSEQVFPDAAAQFSRNVGRIADEAARLGVPLLLSTPPSVLTRPDAPPHLVERSYWIVDRHVTQAYRDTLAGRLMAIARDRSARGQRVAYVSHDSLPGSMFLDDCHLAPAGNRRMATDFAAALVPLLATR